MMNKTLLLVSGIFLLLIVGCSGGRKAAAAAGANAALLRQEAMQLVNCLNQRDYDCLFRLHADDFEGWSPAVRLEDKPVFIEKMVKNYREGNLLVKASIREVEAGAQQGYVYFDWTLSSLADGLETMLLDQRCLQIWRQNRKGQWQLSRSLFY
ncbi:MAG: nuclear transport factor 2 family protein [Bacteroidota bacterium]